MKKQASDMGRRQLLKALVAGSAVGAVSAVSNQAMATEVKETDTKKTVYRETEHVRHYYASLRRK